MKRIMIALMLSFLILLGGIGYASAFSTGGVTAVSPVKATFGEPLAVAEERAQSSSMQVKDLSSLLPRSYSSQTSLSALNGIARGNNELLAVGGSTNYGNIWYPLVGVYNLNTGTFSDLTSQFTSNIGDNWYLSSAAWNGSSFLLVGVQYTSSGLINPAMASYNPYSGRFIDLSSQIPIADSAWMLSGVAWNGESFMIVGYEPSSSTSTGAQPVMAIYKGYSFTGLSANIPSDYGSDYFLGITTVANQYLITGWEGQNLYPSSEGLLLLYSPHYGTFTNLSSLIPSNVFWLGGSAWRGNELLVVGVTYPDNPAVGVLNINTFTYTDLTPPSSNPFPPTYYLLNCATWGEGNTFYVVGQSQQPNNGPGASAVMGSVTLYQDE